MRCHPRAVLALAVCGTVMAALFVFWWFAGCPRTVAPPWHCEVAREILGTCLVLATLLVFGVACWGTCYTVYMAGEKLVDVSQRLLDSPRHHV